jgi:HD-GYP domain-containing protein (c-di-GMP phosphodiesterase class II)
VRTTDTGNRPLPGDYIPVPVDTLDVTAVIGCDLYCHFPPDRKVLYLAGDCPLADELLRDMARRQLRCLYIRAGDTQAYSGYLLARIQRAAEDPACPMEEQAQVLYEGTHFLIERALDQLDADSIGQIEHTATRTVDMALRQPELMRALMWLTRHDAYTYNHSVNVAVFGTALALSAGQGPDWARRVAQGLSLHDIGKARVPLRVLNAPGKLTDQQWALMRMHPSSGVEILTESGICSDPVVRAVVEAHHERRDGSGYPGGLRGDDIPLEARVCTIVDIFDALTTDRPYRAASRTYDGLRVMIDQMSNCFDHDLFRLFIELFGPTVPDFGVAPEFPIRAGPSRRLAT